MSKRITPKDGCPPWADQLIQELHDLEVQLGNVRDSEAWKTHQMSKLAGSAAATGPITEHHAESLFREIARRLAAEGHSSAKIAAFVNLRVGGPGNLPYCDEQEVQEALESPLSS